MTPICPACGKPAWPALAWTHTKCAVKPASVQLNAPEPRAVKESSARGAYPNTDARREYMRKYMRDRKPGKKAPGLSVSLEQSRTEPPPAKSAAETP